MASFSVLRASLLALVQNLAQAPDDADISLAPLLPRLRLCTISGMQTVWVLANMLDLLAENRHITQRDLYYRHVLLFAQQQRACDAAIQRLSAALMVPKHALGITAAPRGLFQGPVSIRFARSGTAIEPCLTGVHPVPDPSCELDHLEIPRGTTVLIVEKESAFLKLAQSGLSRTAFPCVIVTGKGYPDIATRVFLRRLAALHADARFYALCDADPHGLRIAMTYASGSQATTSYADLVTLPGLQPLGLSIFEASQDQLIPLTRRDSSVLSSILSQPSLDAWPWIRTAALALHACQCKAELESVPDLARYVLSRFVALSS